MPECSNCGKPLSSDEINDSGLCSDCLYEKDFDEQMKHKEEQYGVNQDGE